MSDPTIDNIEQEEILERAIGRKWNKYIWSGLLILGVGVLIIAGGTTLHTGAYSLEGLILGSGAILAIIGLLRVLIGMINPALPSDLRTRRRARNKRAITNNIPSTIPENIPESERPLMNILYPPTEENDEESASKGAAEE